MKNHNEDHINIKIHARFEKLSNLKWSNTFSKTASSGKTIWSYGTLSQGALQTFAIEWTATIMTWTVMKTIIITGDKVEEVYY